MSDPSLLVGKKALGKITPLDHTGAAAPYKAGSIKVASDNTVIFQAYPGNSEIYMVIVALCPGTATGTVSWTSHLGNNFSKKFTVEVTAFEAIDIKVEWTLL